MQRNLSNSLREKLVRLVDDFRFSIRILRHPNSPWSAKLIAGCATAYVCSPVQLIPTFIPVIGQLDDALAIYLCVRFIRTVTSKTVLEECRCGREKIDDSAYAIESRCA